MPEPMSTEVVRRGPVEVQPWRETGSVQEIVANAHKIEECMAQVMKEGEHFGVIPGTGSKPSLLKPGAEKLGLLFRLRPEFQHTEVWDGNHLTVLSLCSLYHIPTNDCLVRDIAGSCSTKESKYAYRQGKRKCPKCEAETIFKSKQEPGWFCWVKEGGCGAKFGADDSAITGQTIGRVANPDLADQWNTVVKMADKRSLVAATLIATAASDAFTQDLEDMHDESGTPSVSRPVQARPAATPAPTNGNGAAEKTDAGFPTITARFDGQCAGCSGQIKAGEKVVYDKTNKRVWHPTCASDGADVPPKSTDADWNPAPAEPAPATAPKPASKDAIPGVDPSAKPLLSAANDLAGRLGMTPQEVGNLATRLFKRTVASKDLPGLSETDAEKLVIELEARWKVETGGQG